MNFRVLRPVAVVAILGLTISAGLAPTAASAQQQVLGRWPTQNNNDQNERQIVGTITYFSQFDLRIANGNGRYGNGNGQGQGQRRHGHRHHDNDDQNGQGQNGRYGNGRYPNGQQYPNGGQQYPNGGQQYPNGGQQYPNGQNGNGRYGPNGQYGTNGRYNGNEQRIHLHQGTVINPRGTTLRNGMQIRVSGHPNADGSFEADRIDVVGGQNGQGYNRQ